MKTIIVGFDAFDPKFFEKLNGEGKLPNLGKYVDLGGYQRFTISNPAQSEVSWTSIATGKNPGVHGLFDFVHRNPKNYSLHVSLLPTAKTIVGTTFTPPYKAQTIFDYAVEKGYPATSLWWAATFPARPGQPVYSIPGLGTPDILGRLGVGTYFTTDGEQAKHIEKTQVELFKKDGSGVYSGALTGPMRKQKGVIAPAEVEFRLTVEGDGGMLEIGKDKMPLKVGVWSEVFVVQFKLGFAVSVRGVTRVILTQAGGEPRLYFLPLQIHPTNSAWPYANPRDWIKSTWENYGPFLTLGWPQDTTGLDEGLINDEQFLSLCNDIVASRESVFMGQVDTYKDGVLGIVFDTLDRVQHMFWRDRPDVIEDWYIKLDGLYGRIVERIEKTGQTDARMLVLSDHGFANFDRKVHVNSLLAEKGYLAPKEGKTSGDLSDVDWDKSQAYAVGLNSLYLNLKGREGQGIVEVGEAGRTAEKIKDDLLKLKGPDGKNVVSRVLSGSEAFSGPLVEHAPDLVLGYAPGYRASAETGLGKWGADTFEENRDHWNSDHCIDPNEVQGVIFSNRSLEDWPSLSYEDIPPLAVGVDLEIRETSGPSYTDEDKETVEERLKGLGYL